MKKPVFLLNGVISDLPPTDVALVERTLEALYATDCEELLRILIDRVLGVTPSTTAGALRDDRLADDSGHLRPFTQLLLIDLAAIAAMPGWTPVMKRDRALETLDLAGF